MFPLPLVSETKAIAAGIGLGKYPPAEPGALGSEPLEAAVGVADAAPILLGPPEGGRSPPQIHLIQAAVFLLLISDVLPYHRFVSSYGRDEVPSGPEMLPHEAALPLPIDPRQMDRTLTLDKPDHLRNRIFWGNRDHHVDVIRHEVTLLDPAFLLQRQLAITSQRYCPSSL